MHTHRCTLINHETGETCFFESIEAACAAAKTMAASRVARGLDPHATTIIPAV